MVYQASYIIHSTMQIMRSRSIIRLIKFNIDTHHFFASVSQKLTNARVQTNEKG